MLNAINFRILRLNIVTIFFSRDAFAYAVDNEVFIADPSIGVIILTERS